eukprot:SAG31_NODE_34755_length_329_cov_1.565217_1_plen_47_part_01
MEEKGLLRHILENNLAMLCAPELRAHQFTNGASAGLREVGSFRILKD